MILNKKDMKIVVVTITAVTITAVMIIVVMITVVVMSNQDHIQDHITSMMTVVTNRSETIKDESEPSTLTIRPLSWFKVY